MNRNHADFPSDAKSCKDANDAMTTASKVNIPNIYTEDIMSPLNTCTIRVIPKIHGRKKLTASIGFLKIKCKSLNVIPIIGFFKENFDGL
jgi:hypothetical protein